MRAAACLSRSRATYNYMEKTVKKNTIYSGKVVNLRCDEVLLENGKPGKREIVEHPGGAAILCEKEGKIVLVRQYRYAYGEELLEIPAGKLNRGEEPLSAAMREFEEETGLVAGKMTLLFRLYPSPGYTNEIIYIYLAEEVREGKQHLDEDEFLSVVLLPLKEAKKLCEEGKITDSKTLTAILYLCAHSSDVNMEE